MLALVSFDLTMPWRKCHGL